MSTNLDRRPLGDDDLGSALREAFRHGAEGLPRTTDPLRRTTVAVRRSRARRRGAALAVAAALGAVAVAGSLGTLPGPGARGSQPAGRPDGGTLEVRTDDVTTWPLRGDLAADPTMSSFIKAELGRQGTVVRMLYAGHLGGRQLGVGVLERPEDTSSTGVQQRVLAAVLGPTTGDDTWSPLGYPAPSDGVVSLAVQQPDGSRDVLVLARTDTPDVAVSDAPLQDADGRVTRAYRRLPTTDGVATTRLGPGAVAGVSVLAAASAATSTPAGVQLSTSLLPSRRPDQSVLDDAAADRRCAGGTDATDVLNAVGGVSASRDPLRVPSIVEAVWCRDVEGGRVALVTVTLQDGTAYLAPIEIAHSGATTGTWQTVGIPVPQQATLTTPVVLPALPFAGTGTDDQRGQRWFVHAPGATSLDVVVGEGYGQTVLGARPDADGFAEISPDPLASKEIAGGLNPRVVLRDAQGDVLSVESLLTDLSPTTLLARDLVGPVR